MKSQSFLYVLIVLLMTGLFAGQAAAGSIYILPQVADGRTGNLALITQFVVSNPGTIDATVTMRFFKDDGTAWSVNLISQDRPDADGTRSSTTFTMTDYETAEFYTQGVVSLATGWARIESSRPLIVTASYSAVDRSTVPVKPLWDVGVLPAATSTIFVLEANVSDNDVYTGLDVDTAFAIANPNGWMATITATLRNADGASVGGTKTILLDAESHTSRYVSQLFSDYSFTGRFHGTVRFTSNVPLSIVALRQTTAPAGSVISSVTCIAEQELKHQVMAEREPNNLFEDAQYISLPAEVTGTINSYSDGADTDFFALALTAGDEVTISLVADGIGTPLDAQIRLYRADGTLLGSSDDPYTGTADPRRQYSITSTAIYYIYIVAMDETYGRSSYYRLFVQKQ